MIKLYMYIICQPSPVNSYCSYFYASQQVDLASDTMTTLVQKNCLGQDLTKPVLGFLTKRESNKTPQLKRLARKLKFIYDTVKKSLFVSFQYHACML